MLDERARDIFRRVVETYLETGEPVGSRTLSRGGGLGLSPASIRNTMQDLTQLGLLAAPHTSAGRLPTHAGLRLFVDGLLEIGDIGEEERRAIEARLIGRGRNFEEALDEASGLLSGPGGRRRRGGRPGARQRRQACGVRRPQPRTDPGGDGVRGRRHRKPADADPAGAHPSALQEASNYLNAKLRGRTLVEAKSEVSTSRSDAARRDLERHRRPPGGGGARGLGRGRYLDTRA